MVHALQEINRVLAPDGCLISIHPIRDAPIIEVRPPDRVVFAAPSAGYDYDDDLLDQCCRSFAADELLGIRAIRYATVAKSTAAPAASQNDPNERGASPRSRM